MRMAIIFLLFSFVTASALAQTNPPEGSTPTGMEKLKDFRVIEFRRYTIKEGGREQFAHYFESYFPESFEQLGAIAFGSFLERDKPQLFTWIRGFHDIDERPKINSAFYYGPLWKEYKSRINDLIVDSDNVMLLQPFTPDHGVLVLPAVDVVKDTKGAQGVVVAEIFSVKPNSVNEFEKQAESTFAKYRQTGAKEAGLLVTLDVTNNFPQLPVRSDGPFLVWLGVVENNEVLQTKVLPVVKDSSQAFAATTLLRSAPEIVVLDPTSRSRLRWLPKPE